jgi:hypothetical protein
VRGWLVGNVSGNGSPHEQLNNLTKWAQTAHPSGYLGLQIPGFGLASFQYLRMLFCACTVKPDMHILNFVRRHDPKANGFGAINVIEQLAAGLGLCARHLDLAIWENGWAGNATASEPVSARLRQASFQSSEFQPEAGGATPGPRPNNGRTT